ncbi:MAG: DNA repair protein RecN [Methylophilaceae bacterium]|nr:DNA repair protein RecN [Methylophilaceae bacterium]
MLESLSITNFVIVDQLELNFNGGFTALTGETGAGKSILIDALSLALGSRSESGIVRNGCEKSEISASFNIVNNRDANEWLNNHDIETEGELLLRRVVFLDGRSKAYINGSSSTINQLRELGELLVDIYSQNSHHSLLKVSTQRDILDNFSNLKSNVSLVKKLYKTWHQLFIEHENFEKNRESYRLELEELNEKFTQYQPLEFSLENWESIQQQHKALNNRTELILGTQKVLSILNNEESLAINKQLTDLNSHLTSLVQLDDSLNIHIKTLDAATLELAEMARELNRYAQSLEENHELQKEIEKKIQLTFDFLRKYRLKPDELEDASKLWQERITLLNNILGESGIEVALNQAKDDYDKAALELSKLRSVASKTLSNEITDKLKQLSFTHGKFLVNLKPVEPSQFGNEQVEFLISTYLGAELRPIQKVASGGELSRISLAIRVCSIADANIPSMIFDEVDVGIGGGVAEIVGKLLKSLGESNERQIFVITHLPQVAAQSKYHFKVSKNQVNNQTISHIELLNEKDRVNEVARMLGGIEITTKTLDHAKEILS